jgi:hypothetical protein
MSDARDFVNRFADDNDIELLVMDGHDDAILGVGQRFTDYFVVYDWRRVIEKLMAEGMTYEEAVEYHEFNQVGAWVGPRTPVFLYKPEDTEVSDG